MAYEIVLSPDQTSVPVFQIANLIANALHPQPPEGRTESYLNSLNDVQLEHRSALMANLRYGNLLAVSSTTNLPTDENNPKAVVPVEAFARYVAQFDITVRTQQNS